MNYLMIPAMLRAVTRRQSATAPSLSTPGERPEPLPRVALPGDIFQEVSGSGSAASGQRKSRWPLALPVLLLVCGLGNTACGMKGPLYLPAPAEQAKTEKADKK